MPTFSPSDSEDPGRTSSDDEFELSAPEDLVTEVGDSGQPRSPTPPAGPTVLPTIGSRYRVDGEIASGSMGVVYRGRDLELGRWVAVKVLRNHHAGKADLVRRFVEEAQITSCLQHAAIPSVYGLGWLADGRPYYVMQLVGGKTLAETLKDRPDVWTTLPRFLRLFQSLCEGVAYAHTVGVIHRDIKPANMMIADFGEVKVMDWGVGKTLPRSPFIALADHADGTPAGGPGGDDPFGVETQLGRVLGTPAYMPPEQARGRIDELDERTDVFGLGGILCEILTGFPPYSGTCGRTAFRKAYQADLSDALSRLDRSGADPALVALCKRCLALDRDDRPRDARALSSELNEYLNGDLRRTAVDLARFFELSPDLFCIAGMNGYFRRVNANFSRVLGYTAADLLAHPFIEFVHPADRPRTVAEMEKLAAGLPCTRFLNRYRDVRGSYRWFEWSALKIAEEGVLFAVARDVTDRVELEDQLRSIWQSEGSRD